MSRKLLSIVTLIITYTFLLVSISYSIKIMYKLFNVNVKALDIANTIYWFLYVIVIISITLFSVFYFFKIRKISLKKLLLFLVCLIFVIFFQSSISYKANRVYTTISGEKQYLATGEIVNKEIIKPWYSNELFYVIDVKSKNRIFTDGIYVNKQEFNALSNNQRIKMKVHNMAEDYNEPIE